MASNYKNPPQLKSDTIYETWKNEIAIWRLVSEIDKKKQALAVTLSLTGQAKEAALGINVTDLNKDDGMDKLLEALDKIFLKDKVDLAYSAYSSFENFRKSESMTMNDYIIEYEQLYTKCKTHNMVLPDAVLSFKLLDNSNLNRQQRQLALTAASDLNFENMKSSLRRIFGDTKNLSCHNKDSEIKVEQEGAYFTSGAPKYKSNKFQYSKPNYKKDNDKNFPKGTNPLDKYGRRTKCAICSSTFHWAKKCPHKSDVQLVQDTHDHENSESDSDECNLTLFTKEKQSDNEILMTESFGCAVIDTACTRTVCGRKWLVNFLDNLSNKDRKKIVSTPSKRSFKFGDGVHVKSTENVILPVQIGDTSCKINTEVVDADIPLLLSKASLKRAGAILDLNKDEAIMFDQPVQLEFTSSGHYCVDIRRNTPDSCLRDTDTVLVLDDDLSESEKEKQLLKLHIQFGHATAQKLIKLLQNSGSCSPNISKLLVNVIANCDVCRKLKRTPPKPAVGLPLATEFNETVAVDLHELEKSKTWYLHIIDEFTRFSSGAIIHSKKPAVFIQNFIEHWISIYGAPRKLFCDNGGEFDNHQVRDMCENFSIEIKTTAAYSPWSNGLLERHNYTLTEIMRKIKLEKQCDWNIALSWALMAKNSLSNVHGYSAYQLVFGRNPNLPSVLVDKVPALEGKTTSQVVADHIKALYSARRAFTEAESSERIRRALRKKTRIASETFVLGDKVYYKRPNNPEWKGPGIVVGMDGVVFFIRHGSTMVRVHQSRLIKVHPSNSRESRENTPDAPTEKENPKNVNCDDTGFDSETETVPDTDDPVEVELPIPAIDDLHDPPEPVVPEVENGNNEPDIVEPAGHHDPDIQNVIDVSKIRSGSIVEYKHAETEANISARVLSRAGKSTGKNKTWYNLRYISPDDLVGIKQSVDLSQVDGLVVRNQLLEPIPEENVMVLEDVSMEAAKRDELQSWKNNNVYTEVDNHGQSCISTRWVCTLKSTENGIKPKARLVARGFEEDSSDIQKNSPTCAKESLRLILSIMSQNNFDINSMDIKTAFLQGEKIQREVYIHPPKEAKCDKGKIWRLEKCIYGLSDASLHWYRRVKEVMIKTGAVTSKIDPAVFLWHDKVGNLSGVLACHVDDFIWGGTKVFQETVIKQIRLEFRVGKEESEAFRYLGMKLSQENDTVILHQDNYVDNLTNISLPKERLIQKESPLSENEKQLLRSKIGQILWIAKQSRPDVLFDVCVLASSVKDAKVKDILQVNKLVSRIKSNPVSLKFPNLGEKPPTLVIFSDASFGNLPNGGSQGGYIMLLVGENGTFSPISWNSKRIHRVVRSTLAAETLAMSNAIDAGIVIAALYKELLKSELPIICVTDSKSMFEACKSNKGVLEKRLRIEINSIKEVLENGTITKFVWSAASRQLADCLTKHGASHLLMLNSLEQGRIIIDGL